MKKLTYLIALILVMPLIASAQGKFSSIVDKYQGVKGFTTVNMTSDMFETLGDMAQESMPQGIEGMIILTYDRKKSDKDYPLYSELKAIIDKEDYKTFMDVNDGDEHVHFLFKKAKESKGISEFVMLVTEPGETTFIWMTGKLDLNDLQKMGKMPGMSGQDNSDKDTKEGTNDAQKGNKIKED
jgi:hypothetical protein